MQKFLQSQKTLFSLDNFNPPVGKYSLPSTVGTGPYTAFKKSNRFQSTSKSEMPGPGNYFKQPTQLPIIYPKGHLYRYSNKQQGLNMVPSIPCNNQYIYQDIGNGMVVYLKMLQEKQPERKQKGRLFRSVDKKYEKEETHLEDSMVWGSALKEPTKPTQIDQSTNLISLLDVTLQKDVQDEMLEPETQLQTKADEGDTTKIMIASKLIDMSLEQSVEKIKKIPGVRLWKRFNSSGQKNIQPLVQPVEVSNAMPGPGSYKCKMPLLTRGCKILQDQRFKEEVNVIPGPGSYLPDTTNIPLFYRKQLQYCSAFGSGSVRFARTKDSVPAVGQYNISAKKQKKKKFTMQFENKENESNLLKIEKSLDEITDEPQRYTHVLPQKKIKNTSAFTSSPRFKNEQKNGYLGPGYYDIKEKRTDFNAKRDIFGLSSGRY